MPLFIPHRHSMRLLAALFITTAAAAADPDFCRGENTEHVDFIINSTTGTACPSHLGFVRVANVTFRLSDVPETIGSVEDWVDMIGGFDPMYRTDTLLRFDLSTPAADAEGARRVPTLDACTFKFWSVPSRLVHDEVMPAYAAVFQYHGMGHVRNCYFEGQQRHTELTEKATGPNADTARTDVDPKASGLPGAFSSMLLFQQCDSCGATDWSSRVDPGMPDRVVEKSTFVSCGPGGSAAVRVLEESGGATLVEDCVFRDSNVPARQCLQCVAETAPPCGRCRVETHLDTWTNGFAGYTAVQVLPMAAGSDGSSSRRRAEAGNYARVVRSVFESNKGTISGSDGGQMIYAFRSHPDVMTQLGVENPPELWSGYRTYWACPPRKTFPYVGLNVPSGLIQFQPGPLNTRRRLDVADCIFRHNDLVGANIVVHNTKADTKYPNYANPPGCHPSMCRDLYGNSRSCTPPWYGWSGVTAVPVDVSVTGSTFHGKPAATQPTEGLIVNGDPFSNRSPVMSVNVSRCSFVRIPGSVPPHARTFHADAKVLPVRGGAVRINSVVNASIDGCVFQSCAAIPQGGAVEIMATFAVIRGTTFAENKVMPHVLNNGWTKLVNYNRRCYHPASSVCGNNVGNGGSGAALFALVGQLRLSKCTFENNGNAAPFEPVFSNGVSCVSYCHDPPHLCNGWRECRGDPWCNWQHKSGFNDHVGQCKEAGGKRDISSRGNRGGALGVELSPEMGVAETRLSVEHTLFVQNRVETSALAGYAKKPAYTSEGGAAWVLVGNSPSDIRFSASTFESNTATDNGGAIKLDHAPDLLRFASVGCFFWGNRVEAKDGGALKLELTSSWLDVQFNSTTFEENEAGNNGGAVSIRLGDSPAEFKFFETTFERNVAGSNGGAINLDFEVSSAQHQGISWSNCAFNWNRIDFMGNGYGNSIFVQQRNSGGVNSEATARIQFHETLLMGIAIIGMSELAPAQAHIRLEGWGWGDGSAVDRPLWTTEGCVPRVWTPGSSFQSFLCNVDAALNKTNAVSAPVPCPPPPSDTRVITRVIEEKKKSCLERFRPRTCTSHPARPNETDRFDKCQPSIEYNFTVLDGEGCIIDTNNTGEVGLIIAIDSHETRLRTVRNFTFQNCATGLEVMPKCVWCPGKVNGQPMRYGAQCCAPPQPVAVIDCTFQSNVAKAQHKHWIFKRNNCCHGEDPSGFAGMDYFRSVSVNGDQWAQRHSNEYANSEIFPRFIGGGGALRFLHTNGTVSRCHFDRNGGSGTANGGAIYFEWRKRKFHPQCDTSGQTWALQQGVFWSHKYTCASFPPERLAGINADMISRRRDGYPGRRRGFYYYNNAYTRADAPLDGIPWAAQTTEQVLANKVLIESSSFLRNTAKDVGGAIAFNGWFQSVVITHCRFEANSAGESGGAIYFGAKSIWGSQHTMVFTSGGEHVTGQPGLPSAGRSRVIITCVFRYNIAPKGFAVYAEERCSTSSATARREFCQTKGLAFNISDVVLKPLSLDNDNAMVFERVLPIGSTSEYPRYRAIPQICEFATTNEVDKAQTMHQAFFRRLNPESPEDPNRDVWPKDSGWNGCVSSGCTITRAVSRRLETAAVNASNRTCTDCPDGHVRTSSSFRLCAPCPPHHICPADTLIPELCTNNIPGTFCPGSMAPQPCPPGRYTDSPTQSACKACAPGFFQDANGKTSCKRCNKFSATASTGAISCPNCGSGNQSRSRTVNDSVVATWGRMCAPFKCDPDQYAARVGAGFDCQDCTACAAGTYIRVACGNGVDANCTRCPAGFSSNSDSRTCTACPEGFSSSKDGEPSCTGCPKGTFQTEKGTQHCAECNPGRFVDAIGRSVCTPCRVGLHQSAPGKSACIQCGIGTYAGEVDLSTCDACPSGTYADDVGASRCRNCSNPLREYLPVANGAIECQACHVDAESTPDRLSCSCKEGFFEMNLALKGREPKAISDAAAKCSPTSRPGQSGCCWPCPEGSTCKKRSGESRGSGFMPFEGRLAVRPGFWRAPVIGAMNNFGGVRVMKCDIPGACLGTAAALTSLMAERSGSDVTTAAPMSNATESDAPSQCRKGHTGIICGSCISTPTELWRPGPNLICQRCESSSPSQGPKIALAVVFSLLASVALAVLVVSQRVRGLVSDGQKAKGTADDLGAAKSNAAEVLSRVGTAVPFLQRITAVNDVFISLPWPPLVTSILRVLKVLIFKLSSMLAFVEPCALHVDMLEQIGLALAFVPWAISLLLAAKLWSRLILARRRSDSHRLQRRLERKAARTRQKKKGKGKRDRKDKPDAAQPTNSSGTDTSTSLQDRMATVRLVAFGLLGGKLLHPCVSQQLLLVWVCSEPMVGAPQGVMRAAVDVQCDNTDELWPTLVACAATGLAVITVGLPLVLAFIVYRDRIHFRVLEKRHAREQAEAQRHEVLGLFHTHTPMERVASLARTKHESNVLRLEALTHRSVVWFVSKFTPSLWWWFLVEMLFSLVLISLLQLVNTQVATQYYIAIATAAMQVLLTALASPFVEPADNRMAIVSGVVYFLIVLARVPRHLVELEGKISFVPHDVYTQRLADADALTDTTFALGMLAIMSLILHSVFKEPVQVLKNIVCRRGCGGSKKHRGRRNKAKVVPSGPLSAAAAAAGSGKSTPRQRPSKRHGQERVVLTTFTRCHEDLLNSVSPSLRQRYTTAWAQMTAVHTEVMATAIQACVRGHSVRGQGSSPGPRSDWSSTGLANVLSRVHQAVGGDSQGDAESRVKALKRELEAERRKEEELEHELVEERRKEEELKQQLEEERRKESKLEHELEEERRKEEALEQDLAAERDRSEQLERGMSSMKLRIVGGHLEKAKDEQEAKRILAEHEAEHAEHKEQLKREQHQRNSVSKARNQRKRLKHALAALREAVGERSEDEVRDLLDTNGDGTVDFGELWTLLQTLTLKTGHALTQRDAQEILQEFDASKDDVLSVEELLEGLKRTRQR